AGLIQSRFPPKEINPLYGYRTKTSMANQQVWDEANQYSTRLLIKCGWVLVAIGVVITPLLAYISMTDELRTALKVGLMLACAFGTVFVLFRFTEAHLKNTFPTNPL
ncbi:MAG: SdpI family protein, partial [Cytophagaceae bacterium]